MYKNENNFKPSPEKNLIFKLQSELSIEKSKNYKLSQELFELKLELASAKNNLRSVEADLVHYKSNEKKLHSQIQKMEVQFATPMKNEISQLLIKRPIFSESMPPLHQIKAKKLTERIDSPQTKIYFTPMLGKTNDPNEDNVNVSKSSSSEDDSLNDIAKQKLENLFKKGDGGKMIIGNKIFEDFLIIGAENQDIIDMFEQKKNVKDSEVVLGPKILYSFKNNLKNDHLTTILHCAFPFGIESKKLKITDSFSSLNEILYTSNTLFEQRDRSFVFVLKCDEDIEKEINCQYKISLNSGKLLRKVSLLQTSNPNHLKYCICFVSNDYQNLKMKKPNPKEEKKKKNKKETTENHAINIEEESVFYSTKKFYFFLSF